MKMPSFIFSFLLIALSYTIGQNYTSFSNEYFQLKKNLNFVFKDAENVDEIESRFRNINYNINILKNDLESYIKKNNLEKDIKHEILLFKINELESFTLNNNICDCSKYFNEYMKELGATGSRILLEKDNIRILVAQVGDYFLYYAYARNAWGYTLNVNFIPKDERLAKSMKSMKLEFSSSHTFGLAGEIELFRIKHKNDKNVEIFGNLDYTIFDTHDEWRSEPYGCEDEFPRF